MISKLHNFIILCEFSSLLDITINITNLFIFLFLFFIPFSIFHNFFVAVLVVTLAKNCL